MITSPPAAPPIESTEGDPRPTVARPPVRATLYLAIGILALFAVILFSALDSRRQTLTAPATRADAVDLARVGQAAPTLFVPPVPMEQYRPAYAFPAARPNLVPFDAAQRRLRPGSESGVTYNQPPMRVYSAPAPPQPDPGQSSPAGEAPVGRGGPVLVIDVGAAEGGTSLAAAGQAGASGAPLGPAAPSRVRSGRLLNPSTTVPQGTTIPAVLETALDSSRPGQARAIVSLDVRGFDGARVLIPRGSRLYGEYQSDMAQGQRRALIQWTRLLRPDGVVINIGSPSADRLGRAGIGGKVNTRFFQKFMSAVLQSTMDIGVAVASQRLGNGGLVLLPNLGQALPPPQRDIPPTLTVKQGRSIAVLVARDLDFAPSNGY